MTVRRGEGAERQRPAPLSKLEIDQRMKRLRAHVVSAVGPLGEGDPAGDDPLRARWVPMDRFALSMRRFLVYN